MKYLLYSLILCFWSIDCQTTSSSQQQTKAVKVEDKMCGLNFVAPPDEFEMNPMPAVQAIAADWIAVIPYAYTRQGKNLVHYNKADWQWWGERPEGVIKTIKLAKAAGLKVMLKPQVYFPGSWPGDLTFDKDEDWEIWSTSYEDYLLPFVEMADSLDVDLLCIGTEFKKTVQKREKFWRQLIKKTRTIYSGKLTYASNWDAYETIPFWDALDYIGINAYFPLVKQKTPSVDALVKAWQPHQTKIEQFYKKTQRPIIFTEYGYLSVDACAYNTWELEAKVKQLPINEQAQANALDALLTTFWEQPYWAGGFLWKWFPNNAGHEGYFDRDYTPQGKKAMDVLTKWHQKM